MPRGAHGGAALRGLRVVVALHDEVNDHPQDDRKDADQTDFHIGAHRFLHFPGFRRTKRDQEIKTPDYRIIIGSSSRAGSIKAEHLDAGRKGS
jgi:hypothetical protein